MTKKTEGISVFELFESMKQNELNIAAIYKSFAEHFPKASVYWATLAVEEKAHASHINMLLNSYTDSIELEFGDINREDFERMFRDVEEIKDNFLDSEPTLADAVQKAVEIEETMLEQKCFKVIKTNDEQTRRILSILHDETEEHLRRMQEFAGKIVI